MRPHTNKRRTTTNLKTKNNKNCQKIEPYGSLTTKQLKKKYSCRLVEGVAMRSQGREDLQQGSSWRTERARWWLVVTHIHVGNLGGTTGE